MISLLDSSASSYNSDVIWLSTQNARSPLLQIPFFGHFPMQNSILPPSSRGAGLTFNNLQMSLYEKCIQCGQCKIRFVIFWKLSTLQFWHWHSSRVWKLQSLGHWCIKTMTKEEEGGPGLICLARNVLLALTASCLSWLLKWGLSNLAPHNTPHTHAPCHGLKVKSSGYFLSQFCSKFKWSLSLFWALSIFCTDWSQITVVHKYLQNVNCIFLMHTSRKILSHFKIKAKVCYWYWSAKYSSKSNNMKDFESFNLNRPTFILI